MELSWKNTEILFSWRWRNPVQTWVMSWSLTVHVQFLFCFSFFSCIRRHTLLFGDHLSWDENSFKCLFIECTRVGVIFVFYSINLYIELAKFDTCRVSTGALICLIPYSLYRGVLRCFVKVEILLPVHFSMTFFFWSSLSDEWLM